MINAFSGISARQAYGVGSGGSGGDGISLLEWSNFTYEGSFRIVETTVNSASTGYGGEGLWYNSSGNILFTGHTNSFMILETAIPTLTDGYSVGGVSSLNSATPSRGRRYYSADIPNYTFNSSVKIGGLLEDNSKVYAGMYEFYDADYSAVDNVVIFANTGFDTASLDGLYQIGGSASGTAYRSGYFLSIPSSKQAKLGGYTHACGKGGGNIVGTASVGPAFIAFDPTDIGATEPTPSGEYLYYTASNRLGWDNDSIWNAVAHASGAFIPAGTNCVICVGDRASAGSKGYVSVGYGEAADFSDTNRGGKGYHSLNGDYELCWWAYDLDDLESVKNGTLAAYAVSPYAHGTISVPFMNGAAYCGGCAYDSVNKMVYVSNLRAGVGGDRPPVFHAFSHA